MKWRQFGILGLLILLLILCTGCGERPKNTGSGIILGEPVYEGDNKDGYPQFGLKWTHYQDSRSYEIAILAEGKDPFGRGDFSIRSIKEVIGPKARGTITLLQGVYTDTVTYTVKVRPHTSVDNIKDPSNNLWSNLWEIRYMNGDYTIQEAEQDFDEVNGSAEEKAALSIQESEQATAESVVSSSGGRKHIFPESFTEYLEKEKNLYEDLPLGRVNSLKVTARSKEYGEPEQTITDNEAVESFKKLISLMRVNGVMDEEESDEVSITYDALDKDGVSLFSFSIQSGLLQGPGGRLNLSEVESLMTLEGIWGLADWNKYWENIRAKEQNYIEINKPQGQHLMQAAGYIAAVMSKNAPDNLTGVNLYLDGNKEIEPLKTTDRKLVNKIYKALAACKVAQEHENPIGMNWHMTIQFTGNKKNIAESTNLEFIGDSVKIGEKYYDLEGLHGLYSCDETETLAYLSDFSLAKTLEPVY